ncbi:MAG: sigma-70 family RNA polymerase sigma factor [Burkholderiales bacterium]
MHPAAGYAATRRAGTQAAGERPGAGLRRGRGTSPRNNPSSLSVGAAGCSGGRRILTVHGLLVSNSCGHSPGEGMTMIAMHGVPSSLILRNESWVRQQAQALMRRLPSNVEKADLIQVGLIAVAQAALSFEWEGNRETEEAKEAFVRYARLRVKGAMLDELRQMDHLSRTQRRKVKVIQVARERWLATHDSSSAADISPLCGLSVDEIFDLESQALSGRTTSSTENEDTEGPAPLHEAATEHDEVEARVDTGILMRRLEHFFAALPERDRQVIDAYLGIGMTPIKLAEAMQVSPSRVSQMFTAVCARIGIHLGHTGHRSIDHAGVLRQSDFEALIAEREAELARSGACGDWSERFEALLAAMPEPDEPLVVGSTTRWG